MSCEAIRAAMIDARYTSEPLSSSAVEHLQSCAACRAFSEQDALLNQLLATDTATVARPGFDTRMFALLAEERRAQPKTGWFGVSWLRWWMPVSAGTAIATISGVLLMTRPSPSVQAPEVAHVAPTQTAPTQAPPAAAAVTDDELAIAVDLELLEQLDTLQDEEHAPSLEALSAVAELDPVVLDALMNEVEP